MAEPKRAVALVDDLLFTVKILDAAKRAGLSIVFVKSEIDLLDKAPGAAVVILDLNCGSADALHAITALKDNAETHTVPQVAYISHVEGERKVQAQQAGCDMVLARSVFTQNLPQLLRRYV